MKPRYSLTLKAAGDLQSINDYTARQWGNEQRRKYIAQLRRRIQWLAENPRLGRPRSELRNSLYSFPEGEHIIFYLIREHDIEVLSVLHNRALPDFLRS